MDIYFSSKWKYFNTEVPLCACGMLPFSPPHPAEWMREAGTSDEHPVIDKYSLSKHFAAVYVATEFP